MKNLLVFSGLPSSGKTSVAFSLAKKIELELNKKVMVIGSDQIRAMIPILDVRFVPEREEMIRNFTLILVEKALDYNDVVINDDMNYYKSMRHDFYKIARVKECNFFIVYFKLDLDIVLEWNKKRGLPIPQDLIKKIAKKFDKFGTYSWDSPIFTVDNYNNTPDKNADLILEQLRDKLDTPHDCLTDISGKNLPKLSDFYDKYTRKIVSELLKNPENRRFKKEILKIRKEVLAHVLKNNLNLPILIVLLDARLHRFFED